jgi:hypothetical protein
LQRQDGEPHAQPRRRRQRAESQQVERRRERPLAPVDEERHRRRRPLQLVGHPELLVERGDVAVAREEVVVVALEQGAAADVERGGLAAEPGPPLEDVADVALLREAVCADEPGHAGAEDRDPHARAIPRMRPRRP